MTQQKTRRKESDAPSQDDQTVVIELRRRANQAATLYEHVRGSQLAATLNKLLHSGFSSTSEKEVSNEST